MHSVLIATVAVTVSGRFANAQQPQTSLQDLSLSNAQVSRLHALLLSQTVEMRSLNLNVQSAQETLKSALAEGDPVRIATAVLSLDAAQKALKNTEQANQHNVMALLNDSQKQLIEKYTARTAPLSD
jgi:hypothetical protein